MSNLIYFNEIRVAGFLVRKPHIVSESNYKIAYLTLSGPGKSKKENNAWVNTSEYFNVKLYNKHAEMVELAMLRYGLDAKSNVIVGGKVVLEPYTDKKTGLEKQNMTIMVSGLEGIFAVVPGAIQNTNNVNPQKQQLTTKQAQKQLNGQVVGPDGQVVDDDEVPF